MNCYFSAVNRCVYVCYVMAVNQLRLSLENWVNAIYMNHFLKILLVDAYLNACPSFVLK